MLQKNNNMGTEVMIDKYFIPLLPLISQIDLTIP